jgi:hypothetical protein
MPLRVFVVGRAGPTGVGFDALDAGVDVGLLILVDPSGWIHSGSPSVLMRQVQSFLQEVGVVVSAEQVSDR